MTRRKEFVDGNLYFKPKNKKVLAYYYLLEPWVHFIPVESNFSDLEEKYAVDGTGTPYRYGSAATRSAFQLPCKP